MKSILVITILINLLFTLSFAQENDENKFDNLQKVSIQFSEKDFNLALDYESYLDNKTEEEKELIKKAESLYPKANEIKLIEKDPNKSKEQKAFLKTSSLTTKLDLFGQIILSMELRLLE